MKRKNVSIQTKKKYLNKAGYTFKFLNSIPLTRLGKLYWGVRKKASMRKKRTKTSKRKQPVKVKVNVKVIVPKKKTTFRKRMTNKVKRMWKRKR